jgi:hypothetical protein
MAWLQQHAQVISALASTGMMLIWVVYAWLFYQEFRRQRAAQLFIQATGDEQCGATCLLVNLSRETVHVLGTLAADRDTVVRLRDLSGRGDVSPAQRAKLGPLGAGQAMDLGSFEDICRELSVQSKSADERGDDLSVEIRVAAIHGFREWPVGARRRFKVEPSGRVVPEAHTTEQLRARRQGREVQGWVEASDTADR